MNQFFVYEFRRFSGPPDPNMARKLRDRLGYYIRTELRRVFESLDLEGKRYSINRPMMIPAFLEKGSGTIALTWLYLLGRVSTQWVAIGALDGVFAILFLVAFRTISNGPGNRAA